jgi:hypothetical protein
MVSPSSEETLLPSCVKPNVAIERALVALMD